MKLLAAILATLTLFMIVQPVLTHQSYMAQKETCTADKCCTDEDESCEKQDKTQQQKDGPNNCCNNRYCNPFEICACCYFITTERPVFYVLNFVTTSKEKFRLKNDRVLSSCVQDFLKPPEMTKHNQTV